jgi:ABC-type amino acid transport substrate-binding protein
VKINEFDDLSGLSIGMMRNSLYFAQFDNANNLTKIKTNTNPKLIELLMRERVDTFIGGKDIFGYLLQEQGLSDKIIRQAYEYTDPRKVYLALSKKSIHADSLPLISEAVGYVKDAGKFITADDKQSK